MFDTGKMMILENQRMQKLRKIQLEQLELIHCFEKICDEEHLSYYMLHGTMLGAVRHKGYIPWDDDADFGMPRPDYEKFLLVAGKYLHERMSLEKGDTDTTYPYYYSRLSSSNKSIVVGIGRDGRKEKVWVDIFPLDGMPTEKVVFIMHRFNLFIRRALFQYSRFDEIVNTSKAGRPWYERFLIFLGKHLPIERCLSKEKERKKLDKALKKYPFEGSDYLVNFMGGYKLRELFRKDVFGKGAFYEFEGMSLRGPENYDYYLTQLYGDYMTPPPESERNKHNTELL